MVAGGPGAYFGWCANAGFCMALGLCQALVWPAPALRLEILNSSRGVSPMGRLACPRGVVQILPLACPRGSCQCAVWPAPALRLEILNSSRGVSPMGRLACPRGVVQILPLACPRGSCQCAVWPAPGGRAKPLVWVAQGVVPILPLACPSPNAGNHEFQPGFAYPAFGMPQGLCQSCLWLVPALTLEIASSSQDLPILPLACPKGCANPAFGLSQP